jgi:hypothetical protein
VLFILTITVRGLCRQGAIRYKYGTRQIDRETNLILYKASSQHKKPPMLNSTNLNIIIYDFNWARAETEKN